jgi:hypothetical protein
LTKSGRDKRQKQFQSSATWTTWISWNLRVLGGNVMLCRTCMWMWRHAQGCRTQIQLARGRERGATNTLTYYISNCGSIITAYKVGIKGHHYYPSILSLKQRRNFVRHKHTHSTALTHTHFKGDGPKWNSSAAHIAHALTRFIYS